MRAQSQLGCDGRAEMLRSGGRGGAKGVGKVGLRQLMCTVCAVTLLRALFRVGLNLFELVSSLDAWVPGPSFMAFHRSSS